MRFCVEEPRWTEDGVTTPITVGGARHEVVYGARGMVGEGSDYALAAGLVPAMASADVLSLPRPVSPRLLDATPRIQEIFGMWGPAFATEFREVLVEAPRARPDGGRADGVACFFSGGVDSFHTLLRHRDEITAIIFVHGFDLPLSATDLRAQARDAVSRVAEGLSVELVEVETNLRSITDPMVSWEPYHGGALASVALLFQQRFARVLVPATRTYRNLLPWGSHPLLDPMWSTERTRLEHSGAGITRIAKVAAIAGSELAMRHLRVCWENRDGAYNCGRCEKCVRTMLSLAAAGALGRCETLPEQIDPTLVASMDVGRSDGAMAFARENREALEARGGYDDLVEALEHAERALARDADGHVDRQHGDGGRADHARAVADAERRAQEAARALEDFRSTRRYRTAQALGRPLDAARTRLRR